MMLAWLLIAGLASPLAARAGVVDEGPVVHEQRVYYDLRATSLRELRREMRERKALAGIDGKALGLTRQNIATEFTLMPQGRGCRLENVRVTLSITIHLPRWSPPRTPAPFLQERWDRMITGLTVHEEGHRDNAIAAARELHRALMALGESRNCLALERAARRASFQAQLRFRLRDRHYDRQTRHGETQGSVL
ncbi:DUF922 domain-containing protein [Arenimonas sp. MALMAid1274]|uniref:DUF922 domain-containing protein n=1 Tax=Arenimonas sp. MALMAid1274 TaxID=3411630 RepID=UPI003BA0FB8D